MTVPRFTCPHCQVILQVAGPVPAGGQIQCPRCGTRHAVRADTSPAMAKAAPPPLPAALPRAVSAPLPARGAPPAVQAAPAAPFFTSPPAAASSRGKVLAWVLVGSLLFLGLGGGLAYYCFSAGDKEPEKVADRRVVPPSLSPPSKPLRPKPKPFLSPQDQQRVDQAVRQGVAYLRSRQQAGGNWPGHAGYAVGPTALCGLTLLECGARARDPAVQKTAAWIRARAAGLQLTYELSVTLLFLDRLGDLQDERLIELLALRLVAGQTTTGGWSYNCPILSAKDHQQLHSILVENDPASILEIKPVDLTRTGPVSETVKQLTVLQTPPGPEVRQLPGYSGDNSNTQFAILGLWAAGRHRVPLHRSMALMVKRFRTSQMPDGSWMYAYPQGSRTTLSSGCAGLLGLAVGLGLAHDAQGKRRSARDPRQDPAVQKALTWVGKQIGTPGDSWKGHPLFDTLWLWSIERVAMLYNLRRIDGKDWYKWGAQILVANQRADGAWPGTWATESHVEVSTCLALLFLSRANLARDITAKLGLED